MPNLTQAREAAQRLDWIRSNLSTIDEWSKSDLREFYGRDVKFLLELLADPLSMVKEPEWKSWSDEEEWEWTTPIGGYYVNLRASGLWRASIYCGAMSEIKMCSTAEDAKSACVDDFRRRLREVFR